MVIYLDLLFVNNTLMTYVILWSVGKILSYEIKWWRLLIAAAAGTFYTLIVIYLDSLLLSAYFRLFFYISLNIITAMIMIRISFGKLDFTAFLQSIGYLYLTSFICIGTILSIIYIFGIEKINEKKIYIFLSVGFFLLLILGKKGWKIFHSYLIPDNLILPLSIYMGDKMVEIKGLLDTGNNLHDPLTNSPVIVTEFKYILLFFPVEVQQMLTEKKGGIMDIINIFVKNNMPERVRVLPFSDLGQEHGILVGFRPDKVEIVYKGQKINMENILLALTDNVLSDDQSYQALVNPRIIN